MHSPQRIQKTVVITGASSGIGLALAEAYLERGFNVVGNARTEQSLQAAAERLGNPARFIGVAGDIGEAATAQRLFQRAVEQFGQVDVLINNAGIFIAKPIGDYTEQDLDSLIATNLKGFFFASQAAAAHMAPYKSGHIVNITASIALQPNSQVPALLPVLIKGGINQATRALALELSPHNIMVSAVAPGIVDTPMHGPEAQDFLRGLQPVGRIAKTAEIVEAVLYLSGATFTTGVVLPVDGGMSSGKW